MWKVVYVITVRTCNQSCIIVVFYVLPFYFPFYIISSLLNFSLFLLLAPSVSPSGITAIRSTDGKNVTITWKSITLKEAGGFFEYTIRLSTISSRKRQAGELTFRVPYLDTSHTATGLDGQATYAVSMGLSVDDGLGQGPIAGPTSNPIEIASPGLHIYYQEYIIKLLLLECVLLCVQCSIWCITL